MSKPHAEAEYRELLKDALKAVDEMRSKLAASERSRTEPIAIIGMGCRFPGGSDTPDRFWRMLRDGTDAVTEIPASRWDVDEWYDPDPEAPGKIYCRYGSFIDDVETFDAQFFRISPREANFMDPQQRLLLETSWEALEQAGIASEKLAGTKTGVFVGSSTNDYSECVAKQVGAAGDAYAGTGNTASVAAGRLSYLLGLSGPNMALDTACSSSLVAVHLACQSLRGGECDAALAGGVNLMLTPSVTINFCKARMLSPDGSCKTFDAAADGYVRGEGAGMVLLKRLSDAQRDGDRILAVVRGSAINQDGRSSGLTVPNGSAQQALIRQVLASAGLKPTDIDYIEAHGTGTALGDPIELEALGAVFGKARKDMDPLWVGSLKTNIGHLEAAAGISGLIKLVLSLQHEVIPPHLHFRQPTPHVDWHTNSLRVPTEAVAWPAGDRRRIAGVSSFGFSGTNAHILVEEAPPARAPAADWARPRHLLTLSAKSPAALDDLLDAYTTYLGDPDDAAFADICYTAAIGRSPFEHRAAVHAASAGEAREQLERLRAGQRATTAVRGQQEGRDTTRVAFLFTGQGSQYVGMGRELYDTQPVFRRTLDRCDELLRDHLDTPLLSVLYPEDGAPSPLDETAYTQPALFAIEYALSEMWMSWGIRPTWVIGHSVGEYVAACVAGVFSLEDGLKLIAARGRLMQALPRGGAMVALSTDAAAVRSAISGLEDRVSIAAVNSPRQVVLSGDHETLKTIVSSLEAKKVRAHWLEVSHAFHSPKMEPMLAAFEKICGQVTFAKPRMKVISNVTGGVAGAADMCTPAYWRRHVREPVQFLAGVTALVDDGARVLLEVGPNPILTGLGQQCVDEPEALWLPSLRRGKSDWEPLLQSLGEMFVRGTPADFNAFDGGYGRSRVSLPTYPFQRQRFWTDMATATAAGFDIPNKGGVSLSADLDEEKAARLAQELTQSAAFSDEERALLPRMLMALSDAQHASTTESVDEDALKDAYLAIEWEAIPLEPVEQIEADPARPRTWIVFADEGGVGSSIAARLEAEGHACVQIRVPAPNETVDYAAALSEAVDADALPLGGILHLWSLDSPSIEDGTWDAMNAFYVHAAGSALLALQALLARDDAGGARLWIATQGAQATGNGSETIRPAQSLVWGLGRVITLEHPEVWGGLVDLADAGDDEQAALVREILSGDGEDQLAFRGANRFVPRLMPSAPGEGDAPAIDVDAYYLITGGLGALGREVAGWLADRGARHLVLTSRSGASSAAARKTVEDLEEAGVEVRVAKADAADLESMQAVFADLQSGGRALKGIVHAAGISAIAPVKDMTVDEFADVCHAKVMGAWNLHRLTRETPLDFFVLFSSIASVWGSAGQAHYAAANQFLDTLAHYRRANGLAALSTNWGPWSGSGMASVEARAWLSRIGVTALQTGQALQALEDCMRGGAIQKTVALVDWSRFTAVYEARSRRPFLEHIVETLELSDTPREKSAEVIALEKLDPVLQFKGILSIVREEVADVLGFASAAAADIRTGLFDMGMDSLSSVELRNRLEQRLGARLPTTAAFDYPTIQKMAEYLGETLLGLDSTTAQKRRPTQARDADDRLREAIAIVGMAGRFPGAGGDLSRFCDLLLDGTDLIREVPLERWDIDAYYDPNPDVVGKMYCRYGSFLDDVDQFDPKFFGITPREALSMDPQQRLLLEVSYEALERAGCSASSMAGSRTGVFVGVTATEYARILAMSQDITDMDAYFVSGNALNAIAGRISHALEFHGPSASIDTACSSSLVTVHLACDSLRNGACDAALAGGINLTLLPESTLATCRARMLSADGSCKTFDAAADGYVRGEGAGMVLLKRLSDAEADGDKILAVIRGSAVNQDGRSSGLTVPNGVAQQRLIREALDNAGLTPSDVDFIEAHGSGTALGDPIELEALGGVFRNQRNGSAPLWIGSIKTNTGHLEAAAGITGLIKVVLSLEANTIPPHIHFKHPTHHVNWDDLPLRVPTESVPWARSDRPRIAGVSSFGFSGTNAHIVLSEAPPHAPIASQWRRPRHLLTLSAKTRPALEDLMAAYSAHLRNHGDMDLADICFTAGVGRDHFTHRLALHAENTDDAAGQLERLHKGKEVPTARQHLVPVTEEVPVAFLFTGQGSQFIGMTRLLYETQPVYRRTLDRCDEILRPLLDRPLLDVIFPDDEGAESLLDQTGYTQPALFAVEYALAEMWASWGIAPAWAMGHSVGEYVAACVAGVFSLEDGLTLIAARGRLMQALPEGGAMVALMTDEATVAAATAGLEDKVSIAALNGPRQTVVSGDRDTLESVVAALKADKVRAHWLQVSHAFHSPRMEPMIEDFEAVCREIKYSMPHCNLISNLTGEVADASICTPEYWCRHVREPVQFFKGMTTLLADGAEVILEVGPQPTLIGMARQFADEPERLWLPSLPAGRGTQTDWEQLLDSASGLYVRGAALDFAGFDKDYGRSKVQLPTYCFQHQRFWPDVQKMAMYAGGMAHAGMGQPLEDPVLGRRLSLPRSKEIRFQTTMKSDLPHFLNDHRLFGTVVCPGASHIATMLAATASALKDDMYVLEEVYFPQALVLEDGAEAQYQLALLPEDRGGFFIQAMSFQGDDEGAQDDLWLTHAAGKLHKVPVEERVPTAAAIDVEAYKQTCSHVIEGTAFYDTFWKAGYTLGESFQWVERIWRNDWEGLTLMRVPDIQEDLDDYVLHPGLIDSCLQALAAFGKSEAIFMPGGENIRIPFHVGRVRVYQRPKPGPLWFYGRLEGEEGKDPVGSFHLFDEDGNVIIEVEGYESRRISKATLLAALHEDVGQWMYEVSWQEKALAEESATQQQAGSWLLLADRTGVADKIAEHLTARGDRCLLATPGDAFEEESPGRYRIDPRQRTDFDQLVEAAFGETALPCRGVVHCWSLDATPAADTSLDQVTRELRLNTEGVLHTLKAWAARNETKFPRWHLVTRGAQPVETSSRPLILSGASLWGLGRVLASEHPELGCIRIDLDPEESADASALRLVSEMLTKQPDEDQLAFRQQTRYVARLVRSSRVRADRLEVPVDEPFRMHLSSFGVLDNLEYRPITRREPLVGEVEIAVETSGLNFRDVLRALGMLQDYERTLGIMSADDAIFGLECGGRVVAVGPKVDEFKEGDEVVGLVMGSMATHATVPVQYIAPKPANLSYEEAVASSFIMMTAVRALEQGANLKKGERILIHSAAGGVGQAAVQLAQRIGAEVFGTASQRKWEFLKGQGVDHVMNSRTLDFADEIMELTDGEGVDVVLNSLNGDYIPKSLKVLKPGGRFIEIGAIGIWSPDQVAAFRDDVLYERFDMLDEEMQNPGSMGRLMRDVLSRFERGELNTQPFTSFSADEAVDAFRYVAQAKHIGKVMISLHATERDVEEEAVTVRSDATYLVTGGLGALGLQVASWLAAQGAKHLVLTGRRGAATPEAKETVAHLTQSGVHVLVSKTDVSKEEQVADMMRDVRSTMPPLKGIVHAAGVLSDGMLLEQNWDQFAGVLAPKVAGAWHLYEHVRGDELDFFVSFSSISSLLGSAGQGNYATANAFLDGLAHQMLRDGHTGLSINWGPWSEVGMAAGLSRRDRARWAAAGIGLIPTRQGLELFGEVLSSRGQIGAVPIDWSRLLGNLANAPFFREFLDEVGHVSNQRSELMERLEAAEPERKREILFDFVTSEVARVLGLDPNDPLPLETGFFELGVDSLTAVELRNRLQIALGSVLPTTLIFNYPTLNAMISYFADDVLELPRADGSAPASAPTIDLHEPIDAPDELDGLSTDEMIDRLKARIATIDGGE